jgi:hypothetical protein
MNNVARLVLGQQLHALMSGKIQTSWDEVVGRAALKSEAASSSPRPTTNVKDLLGEYDEWVSYLYGWLDANEARQTKAALNAGLVACYDTAVINSIDQVVRLVADWALRKGHISVVLGRPGWYTIRYESLDY